MKISNTIVVASLALATGCAETSSTEYGGEKPLPAPMASAERAGARVQIYELTPGSLAVVATGEQLEGLEGKSPVQIFEAVAAAPAPAALVETEARIAAAQRLHPSDRTGTASPQVAPERARDASLTAADFQAQFCNPGTVDFDYCWPTSTNNYVTWFYNINWIHAHVNCYSGTLTHAMWYRSAFGSWQLINTEPATGSAFVSTFNEQANGDYEISITGAAGDGYHLSLHGDN